MRFFPSSSLPKDSSRKKEEGDDWKSGEHCLEGEQPKRSRGQILETEPRDRCPALTLSSRGGLAFLICEMGMMLVSTSQGCCEGEIS